MSQLIAIASGKGGVGKTLITAALSVLLQRRGHRVLVADADMGLRNLDLLFGLDGSIHYDAAQAARGKCLPGQALLSVVPGLDFLPASQKRTWERIDIPSYQYVLESLSGSYDYTLIDCPPGRDGAYQAATALADEILFVVEPSPSSLRDAAKVMQYADRQKRFTTTSSSTIFTLTASSRQTQPKPVCRPATSPVSCRMMMASTGLPGKGGLPVWPIPCLSVRPCRRRQTGWKRGRPSRKRL